MATQSQEQDIKICEKLNKGTRTELKRADESNTSRGHGQLLLGC